MAYNASSAEWSAVDPDLGRFSYNGTYNDGCTITYLNGRSEFALVSRSAISGSNGKTLWLPSTCFSSPSTFIEADVMIANDMTMTNEDESFFNIDSLQQGQVVTTHELGHYYGLDHNDAGFEIMRTYTNLPLVGGTGWHGFPQGDDAAGIRYLYPSGPAITNVFASAQKMSQDGSTVISTDPSGTVPLCRGDAFTMSYTVGNNGGTDVLNKGFRVYLTQTPGVASGGTNIFTASFGVTKFAQWTETKVFVVPSSLPNGTYWIQWQVDTNNQVGEAVENDNFVHSAMTIGIGC